MKIPFVGARFDSWMSTVTGLGNATRDKTLSYLPRLDLPLDTGTIEALMCSDDLAYRIVMSLPTKALKDGFGFAVTDDGEVEPGQAQGELSELVAACEAFSVREKVLEADAWGRAYGLGALLLGIEGAGAPDQPLDDENESAELKWLTVVDRREIVPKSYYGDPSTEKFGQVEFYSVNESSATGLQTQIIHESRLIRFGGALTSRRDRLRNAGCDYSVLQRVFQVLQQANGNWSSLCGLMADMSQGVYKINGLMDMIASGNEAALQSRMSFMDTVRSVTRSIVLDAEKEDFERKVTPMAGVNEVMEQTWKRVAAAAEMPLTVLMGTSPAGLNATGESDVRLWYDSVQAHREHVLAPAIARIGKYLARNLAQKAPDGWTVTWPSLWQLSSTEQATYRYQVAQADGLYIDKGVLLPEEVALSRFASGDEFDGSTTTIDVKSRLAAIKLSVKEITDPTRNEPVAPIAPPPADGKTVPGDIGKTSTTPAKS